MPTKAPTRTSMRVAKTTNSKRTLRSKRISKHASLSWHARVRGYASAKSLLFVVGFAALGLMIASVSRAATAAPSGPLTNVNGMCLTGGAKTAGSDIPVKLYTCDKSAAQTWTTPGDGTIRSQSKCLDTLRQSRMIGAQLVLQTCSKSNTQRWSWTSIAGTTTVKNKASNMCMDNKGGLAVDGNVVQLYGCIMTDSQKWTMPQVVPVTPLPTPPSPAPAPTPSPTPTSAGNPSGEAVPIGDLPGWKQTFVDDFTKDAAVGSWATKDASKIVYTGDHHGQWTTYPDGWSSTYTNGKPGYQPGQVLSVHDGILDFNLHSVNGYPSGANPSPLSTGAAQYQLYGRYTARIKSDTVKNYHAAWLLWPQSDANGGCAESDFPEGNLDSTVSAYAHNAGKCSDYSTQNAFNTNTRFDSGWHTYTQEWGPAFRKYYIDGVLIGTSTTRVWSQPERWQMQVEPSSNAGNSSGHFQVDWVAAYSYSP